MEIVAHLAMAEESGIHEEWEIWGPGIIEIMMPNLLHCHEWAYATTWNLENFSDENRGTARRIRSHVIADWIIHYGDADTSRKRKCGWAYRCMGTVRRRSDRFFVDACSRDLLAAGTRGPEHWTKKEKLDFNHSIAEYALDLLLVQDFVTPDRLRDMKRYLSELVRSIGEGSGVWLLGRMASMNAASDRDRSFIERSVQLAADDAEKASCGEDFAVRTVMHKYGFRDDPASARHIRLFLEEVASEIGYADVAPLYRCIADAIADPALVYTGPYRGSAE